jgi:P4 family phage/plasmid primase-like protien
MIQILGLRPCTIEGKPSKKHAFFERHWQADGVSDLFVNIDKYLEEIPEADRWNLYFTVCHCFGASPRDFSHQNELPIDIDDIDPEKAVDVARSVCNALSIDFDTVASIFSGHGVQLFIRLKTPIEGDTFFAEHRAYYKQLCSIINLQLEKDGLKGHTDPVVFSTRRLMRMPGTTNRKEGLVDVESYVIQPKILGIGHSLAGLCGLKDIPQNEQINRKAMLHFPDPDKKGILNEGEFIKNCGKEQEYVSEPDWYAMLSILAHIDDETCHKYSHKHADYNKSLCQSKIEQARLASGPRTCASIGQFFNCKSCIHFGKIKSPILIKSETFIETKATGFYHYTIDQKTGLVKKSKKPHYDDLYKYLVEKKGPLLCYEDSAECISFNDSHWETLTPVYMKSFCEKNLNPPPLEQHRNEFVAKVRAKKTVDRAKLLSSTDKKINLTNGVYCIETDELLEHKKEFGFTYCLPYEYDPRAEAPVFEKFMKDISCGDDEIKNVLLEYAAYAISNDKYWLHKALILIGDGANGKSTFMDLMKTMVGEKNYATISLSELEKDTNRYLIENKLFNFGEETNVNGLARSEEFKKLAAGGEFTIRQLYLQPYTARNKCKLIFSCNSLPMSSDISTGLYRRLLFVPFEAEFNEDDEGTDKFILEKLEKEKPGILNILIKHYKNIHKQRSFSKCAASSQKLESFKMNNDSGYFNKFLTDRISINEHGREITTNDVYDAYQKYFYSEQASTGDKKAIMYGCDGFARLFGRVCKKRSVRTTRKRINGERTTLYVGIHISDKKDVF